MYNAYITKITNIRKHTNADRLNCGECFGNTVIVSLETKENELGVYFPIDGQLSEDFCTINDLVRRKDEFGNQCGGYLDPEKRNIRALKLRGEKSDGLFLPLTCLSSYIDISTLENGTAFTIIAGKEICQKYIPKSNIVYKHISGNKKQKKIKTIEYPQFVEHIDTAQLQYNMNAFKKGDIIYLTLKMHGTSQRTANTLKVNLKQNWFQKLFHTKPKQEYSIITGTRRVVLDSFNKDTSFYGGDLFRKKYHDFFSTRLHQGEEVFYEVLGYVDTGTFIMGECDNKKLNDKELLTLYGPKMQFTYGCKPNESVAYVYRMTYTSPEGLVIEYPTDLVRKRCMEMGVEFVPVFEKFIFKTKVDLMKRINKYLEGPDPIGKTHTREGIVVRVDNKPTFVAYKIKSFAFKLAEGLIKDTEPSPDMEEAQEVEDKE